MTPPNVLDATKKQLFKILKSPGCRKTPVFVETNEDSVELAQDFVKERSVNARPASPPGRPVLSVELTCLVASFCASLCPVFCVSNVTGEGLPLLRQFLNVLPTSQGGDKFEVDAPLEYSISDV